MAPADRNRYENLILLCNTHHQLVDAQEATYTAERLRGIKEDHERWVEECLAKGIPELAPVHIRRDDLYSTLLPLAGMPDHVFGAAARFKTEPEIRAQLAPLRGREAAPFILRRDCLFAFQDLRVRGNPFKAVISGAVEVHRVDDWMQDPDQSRWFTDLLNRSLNKVTGRLGLSLDREHHRYYFPMTEPGEPRTVTYRPLNAAQATRSVVWQPIRRQTGEPRKHWLHLAVSRPACWSLITSWTPRRERALRSVSKVRQNSSSSESPTSRPSTSRWASSRTPVAITAAFDTTWWSSRTFRYVASSST